MNRKGRSSGRRSSILKIDPEKEVENDVTKNMKRTSRRVSFAETYQVKEFPRDSPHVWKSSSSDTDDSAESSNGSRPAPPKPACTITGLDQLLTGTIQSQLSQDVTGSIAELFQSAQSQPPDVLQPMQIYTAKTGSPDSCIVSNASTSNEAGNIDEEALSFISGPSSLDRSDLHPHDKENVFPTNFIAERAFEFGSRSPDKPDDNLMDVKSFLGNVFGGSSSAVSFMAQYNEAEVSEMRFESNDNDKTKIGSTDMDLTRIGNTDMDLTRIGNTDMDLTRIGNTDMDLSRIGSMDMDLTSCGNVSVVREEQWVQGSNGQGEDIKGYHDSEEVFEMEETNCIGGMLNNANIEEMSSTLAERTVHFNEPQDMEETKCIAGILNNFRAEVPGGGAVTPDGSQENRLNHSIIDSRESAQDGSTMPYLNKVGLSESNSNAIETVLENGEHVLEKTVCFDEPEDMTETKCVTGLLKNFRAGLTSTANVSTHAVETEEERSGIESEGNLKYSMEEATENTGSVASQVIHTHQVMPSGVAAHSSLSHEGNASTSQRSGTDLNTTRGLEKTVFFDGIGAEWNAEDLKDGKCVNRHESQSITELPTGANMDMTDAIGEILVQDDNDTLNRMDTNTENSKLGNKEKENITTNNVEPMEETGCLTGILDNSRNVSNVRETNHKMVIETDTKVAVAEDRSNQRYEMNEHTSCEEGKTNSGTRLHSGLYGLHDDKKGNATVCESAEMDMTDSVNVMLGTEQDISQNMVKGKNSQNVSDEKMHNLTTVSSVNMDETECVGRIHSRSLKKDENAHNFTSISIAAIEETECTGGILDNEHEANDDHPVEVNEKMEDFIPDDNHGEDDVLDVDEEITFNLSKKPAVTVVGDGVDDAEKQVKLQKLREMLLKSKTSMLDQIKQGEIKTPSKPVYSLSRSSDLNPSRTLVASGTESLSPCCKKTKFDGDTVEVSEGTSLLLAGYNDSYLEMNPTDRSGLSQGLNHAERPGESQEEDLRHDIGIEDEQMPEMIGESELTFSEPNPVESASDPMPEMIGESELTFSEPKPLASASEIMSESQFTFCKPEPVTADTMCSSDGGRRGGIGGSSSNMSMNLSNKSFASSFIDPTMPLTLENFYKLTYRPPKAFQTGRCSVAFPPVVDMDDIGKVMHAKVTMTPLVEAKKATKEQITQITNRNKEEIQQLENNLEETQPQIFRDCVTASSEQKMEITSKLMELSSTCHKMVQTNWKQATRDMYAEALHDIQTRGVEQADAMLKEVRAANDTMDQLLCVLDFDIEELTTSGKCLEELKGKEREINKEIQLGQVELDKLQEQESQLQEEASNRESFNSQRAKLREQIKYQLFIAEWDLDECEEDYVVFTFFEGDFVMKIDFNNVEGNKTIRNISLKRQSDSTEEVWECVRYEFAVAALDSETLKTDFPDYSDLPKMMSRVSNTMNEIKRFSNDVREWEYKRNVLFKNQIITLRMWNLDTVDMFDLHLTFDPHHPLTTVAKVNVTILMGKLRSADVQAMLEEVTPGPKYFSRLVHAVDFSQLHK